MRVGGGGGGVVWIGQFSRNGVENLNASDPAGHQVSDPDLELVRLVARRDQEAARLLVERHMQKIYAVAVRMLNNTHEAEDVTQEVFLRVWTHAEKWTPGRARFETWMHRVAINLCYDRLRRKREIVVDALPDRIDDSPDPAEALLAQGLAGRVSQAVARLPERQRAAITLSHYQGLSNIEAAEILEVSVEAVESLLARGRRALRAALIDDRPDSVRRN